MIDPNKKKEVKPVADDDEELDIEVNMLEYENLFFKLDDDETEEACEVARLIATIWEN